jgi:membrane protein
LSATAQTPPAEPAKRPEPLWRAGLPTVRYWSQTEVHVYAFSIAANVLLSFYPMLLVMTSVCSRLLHWKSAVDAVYFALNDYFPTSWSGYLQKGLEPTIYYHGRFHYISVLLLLFTANGIFEPMEVALNRAWGFTTNRSFLRNQLVSYALIFACGGLMLVSTTLTALNSTWWSDGQGWVSGIATTVFFKLAAVPISILILFLIYWKLPNGNIRPREVLPAAIIVGLLLEGLKYINLLTWPWLSHKLQKEYGWMFEYGAALILWSFVGSMLILAGAEWAARRSAARHPPVVIK